MADERATLPARAACGWAVVFAAAGFYWAAGGEAGLDTIAAEPEEIALLAEPAVVWASGVLKLLLAALALALARPAVPRPLARAGRIAGALLVAYGGASAVQHALMAGGAIATPASLGEQAARWHLLLWDPWWILGGVLLWVAAGRALRPGRPAR